jgi:predicted dehydrogenase
MTTTTAASGTRRGFLKRALATGVATAAAPYVITSNALGAGGAVPASDRITVGFIGVGGHGIGYNLKSFLPQEDAQPVALCDVDTRQIAQALDLVRKRHGEDYTCQTTQDWREVVARDDVDAVMISTPDHWHVPISLAAIRSGKDVISEKPTLSIAEGRVLADTVKRYGAVYQTSTEDRSVEIYHRMAELVRNGRIGKLERILVQLPPGPAEPGDATPKPVPEEFDWEMWLGPAPWQPYCEGLHLGTWRGRRDFSGGYLADWGAHQLDTAQWANDTERTGPIEVEGVGTRYENGLYDVYHDYHLKYKYANGVELRVDSVGTGLRFEGSEGWVGNTGWRQPVQASSEEILNSVIGPDETKLFTCPAGEHRNFLDCVKSRRDPYFPAEIGHRCCSLAHIGNTAIDLGRKLRWNPDTEEFIDDAPANRLRGRAMRPPWRL